MTLDLNEKRLIHSMVQVLQQHPAEWLSFRRLAGLVNIEGCDADVVAAISEYRSDLFSIAKDRKVKLRPNTVRDVSLIGVQSWAVPEIPERKKPGAFVSATRAESGGGGCYCQSAYDLILQDIRNNSVPEEVLVNKCCWKVICRVRGLNFAIVEPEIWEDICRLRGYLLARENPRGF
jgi:hypothetical protein